MWNPKGTSQNRKPLLPAKSHSLALLPSPIPLLPSPVPLLPSPIALLPSPDSLLPSPDSLLPSPVSPALLRRPPISPILQDNQRNLSSPIKSTSVSEIAGCRNSPLLPHPVLNDRFQTHEDSSSFSLHNTKENHLPGSRALLETPFGVPQRCSVLNTSFRNSSTSQNVFSVDKKRCEVIPFLSDSENDTKCTNSLEEKPSSPVFNDQVGNGNDQQCDELNIVDQCFHSGNENIRNPVNANNEPANSCSIKKEGKKLKSTASEDPLSQLPVPEREEMYETSKIQLNMKSLSEIAVHISCGSGDIPSKKQKLDDESKRELQSELERALENNTEPIVGLDYVTEYKKNLQGDSVRFTFQCSLCNSSVFSSNILEHITGTKHRLNFFRVKDPIEYNRVIGLRMARNEVTDIAGRIAGEFERAYGRGYVKVVLDSTCEGLQSEFKDGNSESKPYISTSPASLPFTDVADSTVSNPKFPVVNDVQMLNNILMAAKFLQTHGHGNTMPFMSSKECDSISQENCETISESRLKIEPKKSTECPNVGQWHSQRQEQYGEKEFDVSPICHESEESFNPLRKRKREKSVFSTNRCSSQFVCHTPSSVPMSLDQRPTGPTCSEYAKVLCGEAQSSHGDNTIPSKSISSSTLANHGELKFDIKEDSHQTDCLFSEIKESEFSNSKSQFLNNSEAHNEPEFFSSSSSIVDSAHSVNMQKNNTTLTSPFPGRMYLTGHEKEPSEEAMFECLAQCNIETEDEANMILKMMSVLAETYLKFKLREIPDNIRVLLIKSLHNGEAMGIHAVLELLGLNKESSVIAEVSSLQESRCDTFAEINTCPSNTSSFNHDAEYDQSSKLHVPVNLELKNLVVSSQATSNVDKSEELEENKIGQTIIKANAAEVLKSPSGDLTKGVTHSEMKGVKDTCMTEIEIRSPTPLHIDTNKYIENIGGNSDKVPSAHSTNRTSISPQIQVKSSDKNHESFSNAQEFCDADGQFQKRNETKLSTVVVSLPSSSVKTKHITSSIENIPLPESPAMPVTPYGWPLNPFIQAHQQAMGYMYWPSQGLSAADMTHANAQLIMSQSREQGFYPWCTFPAQRIATHPPLPPPPPPPPPPPQFSK